MIDHAIADGGGEITVELFAFEQHGSPTANGTAKSCERRWTPSPLISLAIDQAFRMMRVCADERSATVHGSI